MFYRQECPGPVFPAHQSVGAPIDALHWQSRTTPTAGAVCNVSRGVEWPRPGDIHADHGLALDRWRQHDLLSFPAGDGDGVPELERDAAKGAIRRVAVEHHI